MSLSTCYITSASSRPCFSVPHYLARLEATLPFLTIFFQQENVSTNHQHLLSTIRIVVMWVVTSSSDVVGNQRFGVPFCLHL